MKRPLSADYEPSSKRHRSSSLQIENLPEEVLIKCLSYLSAHDLTMISLLSSAWSTLAYESSLWKRLYLSTFSKELEFSREVRERPWRELYKISSNWRVGKVRRSEIGINLRESVLPAVPRSDLLLTPVIASIESDPTAIDREIILQFLGNTFISASRAPATVPLISVYQTTLLDTTQDLGTFSSKIRANDGGKLSITELRLDDQEEKGLDENRVEGSPRIRSVLRVIVFYSNGQFSIFNLRLNPFTVTETYTSPPPLQYSTVFDPIIIARLHYPLLVTLSNSFTLTMYRLSTSKDNSGLRLTELGGSWKSHERTSPSTLSLIPSSSGSEFTITLSMSSRVFPSMHTVSIQVFNLSFTTTNVKIRGRFATAPVEISSAVWATLNSRRREPLIQRAARVTGIEENDGFIATSSSDNSISIFQVLGRGVEEKLSIQFIKKLFESAAVDSIALSSNRCVSTSANSVKIWNLEKSTQVDCFEEGEVIETVVETSLADSFKTMKEKRGNAGKERMRRVFMDRDKIISLSSENQISVMRFD